MLLMTEVYSQDVHFLEGFIQLGALETYYLSNQLIQVQEETASFNNIYCFIELEENSS